MQVVARFWGRSGLNPDLCNRVPGDPVPSFLFDKQAPFPCFYMPSGTLFIFKVHVLIIEKCKCLSQKRMVFPTLVMNCAEIVQLLINISGC